jgi:hypothetical protein
MPQVGGKTFSAMKQFAAGNLSRCVSGSSELAADWRFGDITSQLPVQSLSKQSLVAPCNLTPSADTSAIGY